MKKCLLPLMVGGLLVAQISASKAVTIADYFQANGTAKTFKWDQGTNPFDGTIDTVGSVAVPIKFRYDPGAAPLLTGGAAINTIYDATMTIKGTGNGGVATGPTDTQQVTKVTITITGTGALLGNLLTVTAGLDGTDAGTLSVQDGGTSGGLQGSRPLEVDMTSDFFDPTCTISDQGYTISLLSIAPPGSTVGVFPDVRIKSFTATMNGQFSATPNCIPEPGTVSLFAGAVVSGGLLSLRRRRAVK